MQLVVFLLGVMLGFISATSPSIAQSNIFAGQWRTDWGLTEVSRDGSGFRGAYTAEDGDADNNGTFFLTRNGKTWTGFWAEPNANERCDTKRFGTYYWGRLKLASAFSKSGFDMNWGYCEDNNPSRLWVFNIKIGNAQTAIAPPIYEASSVIKNLKSGFWRGTVRSDAQGNASYCMLSAQKQDEEFTIQLYWNSDGFHVLIYGDSWSLDTGDEFQGRVRIDNGFDGLIDATIFDSESIDYKFGFNEKAREAFQRGNRISLEGPLGIKTFQLNGTRKAVNVLHDCAQEFLQAGDATKAASIPTYQKGLAAYKDKDFAQALANWRPLAKQGDSRLQTYIGEMYRDGEGVAQNRNKAKAWFRKAAKQGNTRGQSNLDAILASDQPSIEILSDGADDIGRPFTLEILGDNLNAAGDTVLHPGDKIDVMFTALSDLSERSWIGFVAEDVAQSPEPDHYKPETIKNRTDGIMVLVVPSMLGNYRLWMYDRANGIMLAEERVRIEVDVERARLELPGGASLEPGQSFEVNFDASPNYTYYTWVAVVDADTPPNKKVENFPYGRFYLKNRADGTLTFTAPTVPGQYVLRMQEQFFKKSLTEIVLSVVKPEMTSTGTAPPESESATLVDQAFDLLEGDPTPQAAISARQKLAKAVAKGDRRAMLLLSLMLESGIGGPADFDKARDYLDQAADALLPDALYRRALLTAKTNPDSALRDIRLAAAEGFIPALQVYTTLESWESSDPDTGEITPPPPAVAKGDLIAIQAMLASLGYQAGPPLGEMTGKTSAAIMAFQEAKNLPVDGVATNELRDQLVKALEGGN